MASILSDETVRQLMATGQVDVLVGTPSLDNADTIGHVVRQIHLAFARHFPRERTLLLNADGGSTDGTLEAVKSSTPMESGSLVSAQALRTSHRISIPYHGMPGKSSALHTIFTAANLLQARVVVVVDPDVATIDAEWVRRLIEPVLRGQADFATPRYARHPLDGPLVAQFVRPFVRAAYGWRLAEPLASEFGCSGGFAAHVLGSDAWAEDGIGEGVDLWMSLEALVGGYRCVEVALGPHIPASPRTRPGLPAILSQIFGTLVACLERQHGYWPGRRSSSALPFTEGNYGEQHDAPTMDTNIMAESFRVGVRELAPVLGQVLPPELLLEIRRIAEAPGTPCFADSPWVRTVCSFVAAAHHRNLTREHIAQALVPIYLGRAAAFLELHKSSSAAEIRAALESLALEYESAKSDFSSQWQTEGRR